MTYKELTIRNATAADSVLLSAWWNDGRIMAHAGFTRGTGETPEQIAAKISADKDGECRCCIMEYRSIPIGETGYRNVGNRTAEIGMIICNPTMQEQGFGRILLSMLLSELFDRFGFERIILDTNADNTRAQHVYELLGFRKVRVRQNAYPNDQGIWQTAVDYALQKRDFINYAT